MTDTTASVVEQIVGWCFRDKRLLQTALTHSTYVNEHPDEGPDYERLEFLGDAVLDLVAARLLCARLLHASEGELSQRRARVIRRDTLAILAKEANLDAFIRLGEGQKRSGGASKRILADSYEALAGAVFLDGGFDAAASCFADPLSVAIDRTEEPLDFKTKLQEACHYRAKAPPEYVVIAIDGPGHAQQFRCEVRVEGKPIGAGEGPSKKAAEQICARRALQQLEDGGERATS